MQPPKPTKSPLWPRQTAVIVSTEQNQISILKNLLAPSGWDVVGHFPTVVGAAFAVREGRAALVVCDDWPEQPIAQTLRYLITNPITICTPILALVSRGLEPEIKLMGTFGRTQVSNKPISPSRIEVSLNRLLREWEQEEMVRLRAAASAMQKNDLQGGILRLKQAVTGPKAGPLASQALALLLRQIGKPKEAEAMLLACLRQSQTNLTVICGLVDLYLSCAAPHLAIKIIRATNARIAPSMILGPDLIQALCLVGDVDGAVNELYAQLKNGSHSQETTTFLARLLFATGREKEAAQVLVRDSATLRKLQKAWSLADQIPQPLPAAS